jgi:sensor domain CHASE-containing protein
MGFRFRIIIGFALVLVVYVVLYVTIQRSVLAPQLQDYELREAQQDFMVARRAIDTELEHLAAFVGDYAEWDDSYQFIADGNDAYVESNLVLETFADNNLCLVAYIGEDGSVVWGRCYATGAEELVPVEPVVPYVAFPGSPLTDSGTPSSGLLETPDGILLIASHPILTSTSAGPPRGTLVMGRPAGEEFRERISHQTGVELAFLTAEDVAGQAELERIREQAAATAEPLAAFRSRSAIDVYATYNDLRGRPVLLLHGIFGREVFQRALFAVGLTSGILLLVSLLAIGLILFLLDRMVLSRVETLSRFVHEVGSSGSLDRRVAMQGGDELSRFASELNEMLDQLQQTQDELLSNKVASAQMEAEHRVAAQLTRDLSSPLGGIIAGLQLLAEKPTGDADNDALIRDMAQANARVAAVLEELKEMTEQYYERD